MMSVAKGRLDQKGVAALTVVLIVAVSTGVGIAVPVVVDAVDVDPDSPLYGLERLGERIRMVGDEDQMKERWDEYARLVDRGKGLAHREILEEFTEKMRGVYPLDREAGQEAIMWMQGQMPRIEGVRLGLMRELCGKLQESLPATYDELGNILGDLENIEQELPTAYNEMMGNIRAHLVLIAEQLRQIAEQHENVPEKIGEYFEVENRLADASIMWDVRVGMDRGAIFTPTEFDKELKEFIEGLSEAQAMLEGAPENAPGRMAAKRLIDLAVGLRDNAAAAYEENNARLALALILAAEVHISNAERILRHASEWEPKFGAQWSEWKEAWENMKQGWKEAWENFAPPAGHATTGQPQPFLRNFGKPEEPLTQQWREMWQERWQEFRGKGR
jgi:hypothetical protein